MSDDEKMFVYTKRGWSVNIMPRNARGWLALLAWMVPLVPVVALYGWAMEAGDSAIQVTATLGFIAVLGLWTFLMIRWMKARSEIVDIDELLKERDRREKRDGRKGS